MLIEVIHPDTYKDKTRIFRLKDITVNGGESIIEQELVLVEKGNDNDSQGNGHYSYNFVLVCFESPQEIDHLVISGYSDYSKGSSVRLVSTFLY